MLFILFYKCIYLLLFLLKYNFLNIYSVFFIFYCYSLAQGVPTAGDVTTARGVKTAQM